MNTPAKKTSDEPKVERPANRGNEPYHKGNVAERLLLEARRILETETIEDITARRLCREVGVTSANFYNHYPNLDYLLLQIAAEEFDKRANANSKLVKKGVSRDEALLAMTHRLVDFSVTHQQFFRLMYGHINRTEINPNYLIATDRSMRINVQLVYGEDRYDPDDIVKSHRTCAKAYAFVAFMTGLARAVSQGTFSNPEGTAAARRAFVEHLTRIAIAGIDAADSKPAD